MLAGFLSDAKAQIGGHHSDHVFLNYNRQNPPCWRL